MADTENTPQFFMFTTRKKGEREKRFENLKKRFTMAQILQLLGNDFEDSEYNESTIAALIEGRIISESMALEEAKSIYAEKYKQKRKDDREKGLFDDYFAALDDYKLDKLNSEKDKIEKLTYIDGKSDWIDLRAAEDVVMKKGDFHLIKLGISMQLPKGYEAVIVPRSSTYKNFGIIQTNHMGVVDETYCGDNDVWMMPAYALRDTEIHVNDRICQFRIQKHQPTIVFEEVDELGNQTKGGIGSTGKN